MLVFGLIASIAIGIALGLLGGGGSILTVPTLNYIFGMETKAAIAASSLIVGATSLFGIFPHAKAGRVRWQTGIIFGLAGMAGAFPAGKLAKYIPAPVLLLLFATIMIVTATAMLRPKKKPVQAQAGQAKPALIVAEGLVVGAVTGLVGAGGGFLVVPALSLLGGLSMADAVGTSLLVIAMKSFAAYAGYASSVSIDYTVVLMVLGAAIVGSMIGSRLVSMVSPEKLREVFGWFVVVMAVFIASQEIPKAFGHKVNLATEWPLVFGPVALAIGVAIVVTRRRRRLSQAILIP